MKELEKVMIEDVEYSFDPEKEYIKDGHAFCKVCHERKDGKVMEFFDNKMIFKIAVMGINVEFLKEFNGSTTKETTKEKGSIQAQIVKLMESNPNITAEQIAKEIQDITADGVRYHIRNLKAHGIIEREGSTKAGKWVVIK